MLMKKNQFQKHPSTDVVGGSFRFSIEAATNNFNFKILS